MKTILATLALVLVAVSAQAHNPHFGTRYSTRYDVWDHTVTNYYGYSEVNCTYTSGPWSATSTCYEMDANKYVYVEERTFDTGYTRVRVYRDSRYSQPYCDYFVNSTTRRVEYRHFHGHGHYGYTEYRTVYYQPTVWIQLNFDTGWDKITSGLIVAGFGGAILSSGLRNGDEVTAGVGAALVAGGAISAGLGSKQLHKEQSDLEKQVRADEKQFSQP